MWVRRSLVVCSVLLFSGPAFADTGNPPPNGGGGTGGDPQVTPTGCPPHSIDIGGVCIPEGCSVQTPGAGGTTEALFVAAFAAAGLMARRRRY